MDAGQHIVYNYTIHLLEKMGPTSILCLGISEEEEENVGWWFQIKVQANYIKVIDEDLGIPS